MKRLGIIMMTHKPERMFGYILPSLENISELKDISTFGISFNGDLYNDETIETIVNEFRDKGFDIRYRVVRDQSEYMDNLWMMKFREDGLRLTGLNKYDYYLMIDDDMVFRGAIKGSKADDRSAGQQWYDAIKFLDNHPDCGGFSYGSYLGLKSNPPKVVKLFDGNKFQPWTCRGWILRNLRGTEMEDRLAPEGVYLMEGAGEDPMAILSRVSQGYWLARCSCGRVNHYTNSSYGRGWCHPKYSTAPMGYDTLLKKVIGFEVITNPSHTIEEIEADPTIKATVKLHFRNSDGSKIDWSCGKDLGDINE